ncbi:MAG: DUF3237 family protein [Bacteroidales bacterium]|nr:DUF3237 family protein [Bacteroidales bacterium]
MKHLSSLVLMVALSGTALAQNPFIKGQYTADPTARVFNGRVYVYPSHDILAPQGVRQDWFCMADYHVFSSDNLVDWTDHGVILDQKEVPWGNSEAYSMWAPDCIQGKDGRYYFYFPDAPKDGRGFGVGVAVSDSPTGPFKAEPTNIKGISGIDPCVLQASDGNNYIFWGGGGLRVAKLKDNLLELSEDNPTETIKFGEREMTMIGVACDKTLPAGFKEGPFAFERNGKYYLTYPWVRGKAGDPGPDGKPLDNHTETLAYAISDNPMGPYEYKGLIMKESPTQCWTNHHSIVEYKGEWYLFYHHNDYSPKFDKNRSVRIDKLTFNADGTINEVIPTLRGVGITQADGKIELDRYSAISPKNASISFLDTTYYFAGWYTELAKGGWVKYDRVSLSKAATTVSLRVNATKPTSLKLNMIGSTKTSLALNIPATQGFEIITLPVNSIAEGQYDIQLLNNGATVQVDWLSVGEPSESLAREIRYAELQKQAPTTEFVMEIRVKCDGAFGVGPTSKGNRYVIPIVGGEFDGPGIQGTVLPGGADYQLQDNPHGRTELEAIYCLRTNDGVNIHIRNLGLICTGKPEDHGFYFRCAPKFEAPQNSKYDYLNRGVFVCTPSFGADGTIVLRMWKVN